MLIGITTTQINVGEVISEHLLILLLLLPLWRRLVVLQSVGLYFDHLNFVLVVGVLLADVIVFSHF